MTLRPISAAVAFAGGWHVHQPIWAADSGVGRGRWLRGWFGAWLSAGFEIEGAVESLTVPAKSSISLGVK